MADGVSSVSRRVLLATAVAGGGAAAGAAATVDALDLPKASAARAARRPPVEAFYGPHQQGIASSPLPYLMIAGFDLLTRSRDELISTLRAWTTAAADLSSRTGDQERATFTFGFGSGLFQAPWLRLGAGRPAPLDPLPAFRGDTLDPSAGDGDLCVQVCAADAGTAHHGVRAMVNAARPAARLRWRQTGFRPQDGTADPRGLFGFRDGTTNLDVTDPGSTNAHLWVSDGPAWMDGGTYLVIRRIRLLLDTWDQVSVGDQETLVGRRRDSNLRLAGNPSSHSHLASAESNGGVRLLRRSYSYDAGVDGNGLQDSGLVFIAYQRDPRRQFVPLQRRLAAADGLNAFSQHLASGVYACPGGIPPGSFIGERLFA